MRGLLVSLAVVVSWFLGGQASSQQTGPVGPGQFFHDAPLVAPGVFKGELAFRESHFFQVPVRKNQEIRTIAQIRKAAYQAGHGDSDNNQDFTLAVYDQNLGPMGHETRRLTGNPLTPGTFRLKPVQAKSDQMMYVVLAASDNYSGRRPLQAFALTKNKKGQIKPSAYALTIKVEGKVDSAAPPLMPVFRYQSKGGNDFASAGDLKLDGLTTADLQLGEVLFFQLPVKKGDMLTVATTLRKPWYLAGYGDSDSQATYTLTVFDDDQVQVAQKVMVILGNPVEPSALSVAWPVELSGRAYLSLACQNTGRPPFGFAKEFNPKPTRVALQVAPGENAK